MAPTKNYDQWNSKDRMYMMFLCLAIAIAVSLGLGLGLGLPRETLSNQQNKDYKQ